MDSHSPPTRSAPTSEPTAPGTKPTEQASPPPEDQPQSWASLSRIGVLVGVVLFAIALVFLLRALESISWDEMKEAIGRIGLPMVAASVVAALCSYCALVGYEFIAVRQLSIRDLETPRIALTAFVAQALSFTLGFGLLSGGAVRLRLYGSKGVDAKTIAGIGALGSLAFWLGLAVVAAIALVVGAPFAATADALSATTNVLIGLALLAAIATGTYFASRNERRLSLGENVLTVPDWRFVSKAVCVGALDTIFAAVSLYLLLPHGVIEPFAPFLVTFAIATAIGVVSHVPGGLGVFEAVMLLGLSNEPTAGVVGALLAYRVIYYLMPLTLAVTTLAAVEISTEREQVGRALRVVLGIYRQVAPDILALSVFVGGVVLLISGALPAEHDRLSELRRIVPLPFVETSHLLASIVGFVLLVLASGLRRRLATAWRLSLGLLLAGAVFSLLKGFDFEEALVCLTVALLLSVARREFYRQDSIERSELSLDWIAAIVVVILASVWLGCFAFRHVEYDSNLWWSFAYSGDAPRFLRAVLAVCVAAIGLATYRLVHEPPARIAPAGSADLQRAEPIVARSPRTEAQLAFLGDKSFLFDANDRGLIMYGLEGRTFIAMGDPIAESEQVVRDLIWRFADLADRQNGQAVFYQILPDYLPAYVDNGYHLIKLGEEAIVDLGAFTLDGSAGRRFRQTKSRCDRDGLVVSIVPRAEFATIVDDIRRVSDSWLGDKPEEKGFSLGFWFEPYLSRYETAVVRHQGRIVAFANIWRAADKAEYSVDLMRHTPDAPGGTMDALFLHLMLAAKTEGYRTFNLGMSPLAGLPTHRLAPIWARIAGFVYRHGDRLYKFEGLRAFKEKFKPEWRPRYLAYRGAISLPQALINATRLISSSRNRAYDTIV